MPAISDLDSLLMSRLRSMRGELQALSERVASHDRLLQMHQALLLTLSRPGPPSSSASPPQTQSPTPGWLSSILNPGFMKRARALGEWVGLAGKVVGAIKILGVILPALWLAAMALWKLALPYLLRLLHSL